MKEKLTQLLQEGQEKIRGVGVPKRGPATGCKPA